MKLSEFNALLPSCHPKLEEFLKAATMEIPRPRNSKRINLQTVMDAVCKVTGLREEEVILRSSFRQHVEARRLFCHVARDYYPCASYPSIAAFIGRNHSTVISAVDGNKFKAGGRFLYKMEPLYKAQVDSVVDLLVEKILNGVEDPEVEIVIRRKK